MNRIVGIEKEWLFMDTYRFMDTSWCFLNVKKTASNIVCLRRCNYSLSAVPLNLTFAHFFMYDHTYLIDNGFGSRQRLLWMVLDRLGSVGYFGLPSKVHSAYVSIPHFHHRRLSVMSSISLLLFLIGFVWLFIFLKNNTFVWVCQ